MDPTAIVQRQLDAYNAHDLARFVATYSDTVRVFRMPASEPIVSGKEELAQLYGSKVFCVPDHRAELLGRLAAGNKVIDHERVHGLRDGPFEAIAVYEVADGLIQSVCLYSTE